MTTAKAASRGKPISLGREHIKINQIDMPSVHVTVISMLEVA
jgi:hypothetical protein